MGQILPGDTLIYGPSEWYDYGIVIKTWSRACHVEIAVGGGQAIASRNGIGVNIYPLRMAQLIAVRRPAQPASFDFQAMMDWFSVPYDPRKGTGIRGQAYDWAGLLCFVLAVKQGSPHKMFCSEFWTRAHRAAKYPVIAEDWDADKVAPAQCFQTPVLTTVWRACSGSC